MKGFFLLIAVSFGLSVWSQEVKMTAAEVSAFRAKVEKETQSLQSIRTDFDQKKHLAFLSNEIASEGKMFLNEKGMLRWEYTKPNKYSVIFKNNTILIDDNGKKNQVSGQQEIFKKINHLIAGSVSGKLFDDKEFVISYYKSGKEVIVKLTPINKTLKKYIKEVNLHFPANESTVSKVKLIEPSGDYTFITFKNKELNVKIDPKIFNH